MLHYWSQGERDYHRTPVHPYERKVWEFQCVISGEIAPTGPDFRDSGLRRPAFGSASLWVFAPENIHGWTGRESAPARVAVFHFTEVAPPVRSLLGESNWARVGLSREELAAVSELTQGAAASFRRRSIYSELQSHYIAGRLSLLFAAHQPEAFRLPGEEREEILVARAEAILRAEVDRLVAVADLSNRLGVSVAQLRRAFAARRGYPPQEARERISMERGREELLRTDRSILDIALSFGYSSHSSFTKAYRRQWGEPPAKTRATRRAKSMVGD